MSDRRYLKRRGNVWWVQVSVPAELRAAYGRAVYQQSLRTADLREAQRSRWERVAEAQKAFERLRGRASLSSAEIEQEAEAVYRGILAGAAEAREAGRPAYSAAPETPPGQAPMDHVSDDEAEIAGLDHMVSEYGEALTEGDLSLGDTEARVIAERKGLSITEDDLRDDARRRAFDELRIAIIRARYEAFKARIAYLRGDTVTLPAAFNPAFIDPVTLRPKGRAARTRPGGGPALKALIDKYVETMGREIWTPKTRHQFEQSLQLFVTHIGNQPIASITKADVRGFREDVLEKLPVGYGKRPKERNLPLSEITSRPGAKLQPKTIQRHLTALRGFFDWAEGEGYREKGDNPAEGFRFRRSKRPKEERDAWSDDELRKLFASPVWTGCKSAKRRKEPGTVIIRDALFWIPLIALFSGLRLEEAAQLRPQDIREVEGTVCFDVAPSADGQRVKSKAGVRIVPVHSELTRLGFLNHIQVLRKAGTARLFPELRPGGPDNRFGAYVTKRFADYRRSIGLSRPGVGIHSLRSNFATALYKAGVVEATAADLLGHEGGTMTYGRYRKGVDVPQLRAAVEAVRFPGVSPSHIEPEKPGVRTI